MSVCARWYGVHLPALLGALLLLVPAHAAAAEPGSSSLTIDWHAPSECPDEVSVRDSVARLFGGALPETELSVHAQLSAEAQGYLLVLRTTAQGHEGVKRLNDVSCQDLTRAAAVLIALAIDPNLTLSESDGAGGALTPDAPPAASPSPSEVPPPAPVEPAAPAAAPGSAAAGKKTDPGPAAAADGTLAALGEYGTVPGWSPGVLVQLDARLGMGLLGIGAEYLAPQRAEVPGRPELGALIRYVGAEAFGCVGAFARRAAPAACAGVSVGRLSGESRGAPDQGSGSLLWVTPEVGGIFRYALRGPVRLEAGVLLRFAVQDSEFTLDNVGRVYAPAAVAVRLHVGGVLQFF